MTRKIIVELFSLIRIIDVYEKVSMIIQFTREFKASVRILLNSRQYETPAVKQKSYFGCKFWTYIAALHCHRWIVWIVLLQKKKKWDEYKEKNNRDEHNEEKEQNLKNQRRKNRREKGKEWGGGKSEDKIKMLRNRKKRDLRRLKKEKRMFSRDALCLKQL
jgi:hypothetical protein